MNETFDANKARTELLAEIDAVLQGTAYWQGGRLDTIKHLLAHVEKAEAEAAVRGGEWCASNRAKGRGPCGACAWCCQQIMASLTRAEVERDRLRVLLNRCAPQVGSTDDPQYDLACEVNEALSNNVSAPPVRELELFVRVPGLFRGWEIEQVLEPGHEFHIVNHGECPPGSTPLYAVNRRRLLPDEQGQALAEAHRP